MKYKKLGNKIKYYRIKRKKSSIKLAELIGVGRTYLSRVECGHEKPSTELLLKISNYLNLSNEEKIELLHLLEGDITSSSLSAISVLNQHTHFNYSNMEKTELFQPLKDDSNNLFVFKEVKSDMSKQEELETKTIPVEGDRVEIKVPDNIRVLYTDAVFVSSSKYGIILDFAQSMGPTNVRTVVSRVGLSLEHAKDFEKLLQDQLIKKRDS